MVAPEASFAFEVNAYTVAKVTITANTRHVTVFASERE